MWGLGIEHGSRVEVASYPVVEETSPNASFPGLSSSWAVQALTAGKSNAARVRAKRLHQLLSEYW